MKTEDLSKVRIAVLGKVNVGKSALTVRYLTRRFIGEYRSNADLLYRQTVTINNSPLEVEIIDVSGETRDSFPSDQVSWADGCIIVYSLIDKESFNYAVSTLQNLQKYRDVNHVPITLLGNKLDLEHLREVDEALGKSTALQYNCSFYEVSVADNSPEIYHAFDHLLSESRGGSPPNGGIHKIRKFSVTKMLGTLIGGEKKCSTNSQGGTVVVCNKSDLCRNRVLKRRQNYVATPATSL
uniref:small monomeric GTPase n=1 Tax=Cacopsylla melanoneura TaxID=428564 RepID=A0A8D8WZ25_9HEMI